jgi:phosphatidylglycerophosphatase A
VVQTSSPRGFTATLATVIATGFGSGYSPFAPGTAGSLVGLLFVWPLMQLPGAGQVAAVAILFLVGVVASTHVARRVGIEDPGIVVVDEIMGMWASLLFLPLTWWTVGIGFVLFRIMDIVKPYPARQLEHLPEGWGIMADDLMAGIYANLVLRGLLMLWGAR